MMHRYRCGESFLHSPKLAGFGVAQGAFGVAQGAFVTFDRDFNLGCHINRHYGVGIHQRYSGPLGGPLHITLNPFSAI
jgi:hypothetical protein